MTMTRAEGREIDRLARGEQVQSTHSCARPGCWHSHIHHKHKTRGHPCELCSCPGLIRFEEAGKLMEGTITKPEVARRTWLYVYERPPWGWPLLVRKGSPEASRADKMITAHNFRITITQEHGGEPVLDMIKVNGAWPNLNPVHMVTVHHDPAKLNHNLIVFAPGWVLELAGDAIDRSRAETILTDPFGGCA